MNNHSNSLWNICTAQNLFHRDYSKHVDINSGCKHLPFHRNIKSIKFYLFPLWTNKTPTPEAEMQQSESWGTASRHNAECQKPPPEQSSPSQTEKPGAILTLLQFPGAQGIFLPVNSQRRQSLRFEAVNTVSVPPPPHPQPSCGLNFHNRKLAATGKKKRLPVLEWLTHRP